MSSINQASWDRRVPYHIASEFYDVPGFIQGNDSINEIEDPYLQDLKGLKVLHLQCHFGMDSIALARRGAQVTGLDFSEAAIEEACKLAISTGMDVQFVCADVHDADKLLPHESFDLIFTSYGVIGWIPDLMPWGKIISKLLKPGGRFLLTEFHPVYWMLSDDHKYFQYSYFNTELITDTQTGTYADANAPIEITYESWNHSFQDIFDSLLTVGLRISSFKEYDFSPYNINVDMYETSANRFMIKNLEGKMPLVFLIEAKKP
jgi:2-polyprenyl-3-methyl-5-hydroxy-6-metoxy-1,4-benzoquinol methylase